MRIRKGGRLETLRRGRHTSPSWMLKGSRICFRLTAVLLVSSYGYMFLKFDHSFKFGRKMEQQVLEELWSGNSKVVGAAASAAESASAAAAEAASVSSNQLSKWKGQFTKLWASTKPTSTSTSTSNTDSTSLQALEEGYAKEKARLEAEIERLKAGSIPKQPPQWDEISFEIDPQSQKRDITGEDVRDLAVPSPRGLRLAFAGDSLTRYQYLSMAHFFRHGDFPDPSERPNFVVETTHNSWMDFYNHTNSGLLPFEKCDCFRPETKDIRRLVTEVRENRYYHDPVSGNSLIYLMKWGWHPMTLTWEPEGIHQRPPQFTPSLTDYLPTALPLKGDWITVFDHLAKLNPKPHIVVMNAGLWKPRELWYPQMHDLIVKTLKEHNMIGIYKTTTKRRGDEHPTENQGYEKELCKKMLCLDSSWTDYVPDSMYWDNLHFVEPIYKRLNIQLLQLLKEQNLLDTFEPKFSPVLNGVKPLYGIADDKADNEELPHPHAGARFADGRLGLVVNPDPRRMSTTSDRPMDCPKGPFPGIEEAGGYDALHKIREGLIQSRQSIATASSQGRKPPRILCMVYTHEGAHDRLRAIANTWGKDCDGFFAASTKTDHSIGAINLLHKGKESYDNMWQKARSMWAYAYDYYKDDYDYFHICGDDSFVIPDNLRAYAMSDEVKRLEDGYIDAFHKVLPSAVEAAKTRPRPLLFGAPHYRSGREMLFPDGGPGYTFNKAALELFGKEALPNVLPDDTDPREDVFVGSFFKSKGVFTTDTRDAEGGARYIDTDLDHQSKVDGVRGLSRLQPASLETVFKIKWTYLMGGISSQTIAIHVKWSNFAEDMPGVIYRYYEMLHYDETHCSVAKGAA